MNNFRGFLFACLEDEIFRKWDQLLKNKFALMGANFILYEMTPIYIGDNNVNERVASPVSVPIHIKAILILGRHTAFIQRLLNVDNE